MQLVGASEADADVGFMGAAARAVQSAAPQRNRLEGVRRRERRIERRGKWGVLD